MNKKPNTVNRLGNRVGDLVRLTSTLGLLVSGLNSQGSARTIAYDDFNDGNYRDGVPATWTLEANSPRVTLEDGDVTLSLGSCCGGLGLAGDIDTSVSLRTQVRVRSGTIGLAARWGGGPSSSDGYFTWINPDGSVDALTRVGGVETEYDAIPLPAPKLLNEDIIFQMDLNGNNLSARFWPVSGFPPLAPQWKTELTEQQIIPSGQSGVYVGSDSERSESTFRYVHLDTRPIAITYDDFADGNDRGWERVQNIPTRLGGGNYLLENGEYRMQSSELIPPGTGAGNADASMFSILSSATWTSTLGGPDKRNGLFRVKARANEEGTSILYGMRNTVGLTTYAFFASTETGQFSIGSFRGAIPATTHVASDAGDTPFRPGEDWILEASTLGNRITLKYWRDGDQVPSTPQLVFLDPEPLLSASTSEVFVGGFVDNNHPTPARLDMSFDDTYFHFIDGWTEGDFSVNEQLDVTDIDRLNAEIQLGANDHFFDLTQDGLVNDTDRTFWIKQLKRTYLGDANLDGEFDSADLVDIFKAGQYEDGIMDNSSWATGDWNGDGDFDSGDLTLAFQDGGYEKGTLATTQLVPEPTSMAIALLIFVGLVLELRGRKANKPK
jgi:hypothetical protein